MRFSSILFQKFKDGVGDITKKYANLPESYIKRTVEEIEWSTPRGYPQYSSKKIVHKKGNFGLHRAWTNEFQQENEPNRRYKKVFLEPFTEWSYFKGDRVEILVGPDKGKQGIIAKVIQERNWVIVEGLNCKMKTMGKSSDFPGTVVKIEQPLLVQREVALVDPSDLQGTNIEWRFTEDGEKVRVSVRSGRIIPVPVQADETYDYKSKSTYKESPSKDTTTNDLKEITFKPNLATFEMDIMKSFNIKEDRIPVRTYWY